MATQPIGLKDGLHFQIPYYIIAEVPEAFLPSFFKILQKTLQSAA
jgi:hypothetical protein